MFGLRGKQIEEAGRIGKILADEWQGLVAGYEGYVLRDGLEAAVRWGEMVSLGRPHSARSISRRGCVEYTKAQLTPLQPCTDRL